MLADRVIKETYRKTFKKMTKRSMESLRRAIIGARRFSLDEAASAFVADLSVVPFLCKPSRRGKVLDSIRRGAILPYETCWVEYRGVAFRNRLVSEYEKYITQCGQKKVETSNDIADTVGHLLERRGDVVRCTFFYSESKWAREERGFKGIAMLPFVIEWRPDDMKVDGDIKNGMLMHGITGFYSPSIGVDFNGVSTGFYDCIMGEDKFKYHILCAEFSGSCRYIMSLISAFNTGGNLEIEGVAGGGGMMAGGFYRKKMDYYGVSLNLKKGVTGRSAAKRMVALGKRAHLVRSHFRVIEEGEEGCNHTWTGNGFCQLCGAHRVIVREHKRGDASLGWVGRRQINVIYQ